MLSDHQMCLLEAVDHPDRAGLSGNAVALAFAARAGGVPSVVTALVEPRGAGRLLDGLVGRPADTVLIIRSCVEPWRDARVVDAVARTGCSVVVLAGLWTELCLSTAALAALGAGYRVLVVTDASAGLWAEAHDWAVEQMRRAGAELVTTAETVDIWAPPQAVGRRPLAVPA